VIPKGAFRLLRKLLYHQSDVGNIRECKAVPCKSNECGVDGKRNWRILDSFFDVARKCCY
jgi:hypothetical protein